MVVVATGSTRTCTGRQPRRERAGVVLEQHAEEPLDRAEQGAVQHDRPVPLVVGADVLETRTAAGMLKSNWIVDSCQRAADGVADVDVDLRAVERTAALVDLVREPLGLQRRLAGASVAVPRPRRCRRTSPGAGRQVGLEVRRSRRPAAPTSTNCEQRLRISPAAWSGRAEDVAVVLREAADPHEAVERAGPLVAVHGAELEQPQRQLAVRALPTLVDQEVHRAVHRLRVVLAVVHLHRRVHAVGVEVEVAGLSRTAAPW